MDLFRIFDVSHYDSNIKHSLWQDICKHGQDSSLESVVKFEGSNLWYIAVRSILASFVLQFEQNCSFT